MSENTESKYFDLITTGVGYLNRARTVKLRQGAGYECVSIAALRGHVDSPEYSYFDCRIVGEQALAFVETHKEAINDYNTKVLVRFNVGDGEATSYEISSGDNKGQRRHCIKARLLKITWAKVGDDVIDLGLDEAADDAGTMPAGSDGEAPQRLTPSPAEAAVVNKPRWEDTLGDVVNVEEDDPYFVQKTARLQKLGYRWHSESREWRKAA
jgi:hypothetical protein